MTDPTDATVVAPTATATSDSIHFSVDPPEVIDPPVIIEPIPVDAVPMSDALADAVVSQLSSEMPGLTAEQIKSVVAAVNTVQSGDEVGTVRKSGDGVFAVRISLDGVHKWHLVNPVNGSRWDDNENSIIMTWPTVP